MTEQYAHREVDITAIKRRLREVRVVRRISTERAGSLVGRSARTVRAWENPGQPDRMPRADTLATLLGHYLARPEYVLYGVGARWVDDSSGMDLRERRNALMIHALTVAPPWIQRAVLALLSPWLPPAQRAEAEHFASRNSRE